MSWHGLLCEQSNTTLTVSNTLRREEIDRYAIIEERKLKDPFSIKKCIKALERLEGLSMADMLKAADIFTANKENREVFLSFSSNELRLGWLTGKVRNT